MPVSDFVLLLTARGMGHGPEELRLKLLARYLQLLDENGDLPSVICMYTDGVKLVAEGSPVLEQLSSLERKGIRLIACSTCLEFYGLTGRVKTGVVGSMADILEAQLGAQKVISL